MQHSCILRHMREIKDNYIKDREKFNKLVGCSSLLSGCLSSIASGVLD